MKKKTVKLPKNWGKMKCETQQKIISSVLSKNDEIYLAGFNDGLETCKEVIREKAKKKLVIKKKQERMKQYHKIQTVFKRDEKTKRIIVGDYSLPEFEYLKDNNWVFTEKVDGTNTRVMWNGSSVVFGGKSDDAQMPMHLLYKLQELFEGTAKKQLFVEKFGAEQTEVCLYGEGYGSKIQAMGKQYIPDGHDFVLFDVKIGGWYLQRKDVEDIAKHFGIRVVPIIGAGTLQQAIELTQAGFNSQWGNFVAEGIVARPATEMNTRSGERIITKIKHRDFK